MKAERAPGSPGGARLRALRWQRGKTQLWVEAEAELGSGYLQRVEAGKVATPERPTLERILAALGARYSERRGVLELFGYRVATSPPDDEDLVWARSVCRTELDEVTFPAYVLDCTHRLVTWNRFVPHLFGVDAGAPLLGELAGRSLIAPWFDLTSPLAALLVEPRVFLLAQIHALRAELQPFRTETWYAELLADLLDQLPRFRYYWALAKQEPAPAGAGRARVLVRLNVPRAGTLQFRLTAEHFVQDARFRTIYYLPADAETLQACAGWASQQRVE